MKENRRRQGIYREHQLDELGLVEGLPSAIAGIEGGKGRRRWLCYLRGVAECLRLLFVRRTLIGGVLCHLGWRRMRRGLNSWRIWLLTLLLCVVWVHYSWHRLFRDLEKYPREIREWENSPWELSIMHSGKCTQAKAAGNWNGFSQPLVLFVLLLSFSHMFFAGNYNSTLHSDTDHIKK